MPAHAPFPRTESEWLEKGMSPEQAAHKMRQDVFGHDYQVDAKGNPIETGKGSPRQQTQQHAEAKARSETPRNASVGYSPALDGAYDPRPPRRRQAPRKRASKPAPIAN